MNNYSKLYFLLICLLSTNEAFCRNQHWYQQFYHDKATSDSSVKINLAPDEVTSVSSIKTNLAGGTTEDGSIKLKSFDRDLSGNGFDDFGRTSRLSMGAIVGIAIGGTLGCFLICVLCLFCCINQRNTTTPGHIVVMNDRLREIPPPQMIAQHVPVPYQPGAYPTQRPPYIGQTNPQVQHMNLNMQQHQGINEQWQKFQPHNEMHHPSNYSPHDGYTNPNYHPDNAPPPYFQKE